MAADQRAWTHSAVWLHRLIGGPEHSAGWLCRLTGGPERTVPGLNKFQTNPNLIQRAQTCFGPSRTFPFSKNLK
jgi:hypothetical protein